MIRTATLQRCNAARPLALGLGQGIAGHFSCSAVRLDDGSGCQLKFQPTCFSPCQFHLADGFQHIVVLLPCQLGNRERRHVSRVVSHGDRLSP